MKKIFAIVFSLTIIIIISIPLTVFATNTSWTSTENVILSKKQNTFNIEISVNNPTAYAGAEFGIQCAEGVTIKSIKYSSGTSKAGPVVARGLTWFSFFSGNNNFSDKVISTITLGYAGTQNTSILIDNISIYTKNGTVIDTEMIASKKVITINREGATTPGTTADAAPGTSHVATPSESASNGSIPTTGKGSSNSNEIPINSNNSTTGIIPNNQVDITNQITGNILLTSNKLLTTNKTITNNKPTSGSNPNNQVDSNNSPNKNSNNESSTNSIIDDNNIQSKNTFMNIVAIIIIIMSLCVNVILGYYVIKIKKQKEIS